MKKIILNALSISALVAVSANVNAHLLAFDKLTTNQQNIRVVTSFEMNKEEIIEEFHLRSKYFEVEKWMMSQNILLDDNHFSGQHANQIASTKALASSTVNVIEVPPIHDLIDPFNSRNQNSSANDNTPINKLNIAGFAAVSVCNAHASVNYKAKLPNLVPRFNGPQTLVDAIYSRGTKPITYELSHGLSFECVYVAKNIKPIYEKKRSTIKTVQKINVNELNHSH
ncbi:hypothetical protein V6237_12360 [Pseudoalteromonas carrageenovora]|uniref:hypothetical protein n=1 Tax=Pseudoalteromonas carrageenovora TaxID=227 RepID=UPI00311DD7F7